MKSVVIFDTPSKCLECPMNKCPEWVDADSRPESCPLKSLPQREAQNPYSFEGYANGVSAGFNRCLDMIGG